MSCCSCVKTVCLSWWCDCLLIVYYLCNCAQLTFKFENLSLVHELSLLQQKRFSSGKNKNWSEILNFKFSRSVFHRKCSFFAPRLQRAFASIGVEVLHFFCWLWKPKCEELQLFCTRSWAYWNLRGWITCSWDFACFQRWSWRSHLTQFSVSFATGIVVCDGAQWFRCTTIAAVTDMINPKNKWFILVFWFWGEKSVVCFVWCCGKGQSPSFGQFWWMICQFWSFQCAYEFPLDFSAAAFSVRAVTER